jgi:DNA-binding NarL/FixJ family response regulator
MRPGCPSAPDARPPVSATNLLGPAVGCAAPMPTLLIADDDELVREALATRLAAAFDVVAVAGDAEEAVALARRLAPDVALLDVQMPGGGGLRATTEIARDCPRTAIVILSADEEHDAVVELLAAGATSYLRKDQPGEEVAATLRQSLDAHRRLRHGAPSA